MLCDGTGGKSSGSSEAVHRSIKHGIKIPRPCTLHARSARGPVRSLPCSKSSAPGSWFSPGNLPTRSSATPWHGGDDVPGSVDLTGWVGVPVGVPPLSSSHPLCPGDLVQGGPHNPEPPGHLPKGTAGGGDRGSATCPQPPPGRGRGAGMWGSAAGRCWCWETGLQSAAAGECPLHRAESCY